jgi:Domain of unknown function (DUF1707)
MLKNAFAHGRLTRDELDARAGRTLTARTYAELAALTADIPDSPAAARPASPSAPGRRRPLARAATSAMARFRPVPAPTRPKPTFRLTSHGSAGGTFPPERAGHRAASGRRRERCDAGETSTGIGASPVAASRLTRDACCRAVH